MSATNQHQEDNLLDREIAAAMKLGIQKPHADFTRELMSVIAEEEAAPVVVKQISPSRLSWTLVALGVVFLVIALLVPSPSTSSSAGLSWTSSSVYTIGALCLISLLALTQTKPRFR